MYNYLRKPKIVAGLFDSNVCVWDATSGKMILDPLKGHKGSVKAIAISLDDKYINKIGISHTSALGYS